MKKLLNFDYSMIQGTYWMYFGVACSFSSVFLLDKGYLNSEIGLILALGSILSVILQPLIANITDKTSGFSLIHVVEVIILVMLLLNTGLFIFHEKSTVLTVLYILIVAWVMTGQPFINTLNFFLQTSGCKLNFGIARSMGSLLYSLLMAVLGSLALKFGVTSIPISGQAVLILMLLFIILTHVRFNKEKTKTLDTKAIKENMGTISFSEFIKRNRYFFFMSFGIVGLYFGNAVLNNFMMQIVDNVGGTSEDMGRVLSLMAALEIPTMVFFSKINKKFSYKTLILIASFGFTLKVFLCLIATSVFLLYVAQLAQLIAFALFLPAMVHFIDETMDQREAVRGQALYIVMATVGSVISSILGGIILDIGGATVLLFVSTIFSSLGMFIVIYFIRKIRN